VLTTHLTSNLKPEVCMARAGDAEQVRRLDNIVFPESSLDLQRAPAGELEEAIDLQDVHVVKVDGEVIAYLHMDSQNSEFLYLSGIGVISSMRDGGLGTTLLYQVLEELGALPESGPHRPVFTVTSPRNSRMIHVLFKLGFAGRWGLPNHFGSGRHRVAFQMLSPESKLRQSSASKLVRLGDIHTLSRNLDEGWVIQAQHKDARGPFFKLVRGSEGDFADCPHPTSPGTIAAKGDFSALVT
jgi:ribosomal protein S18 acetylase RimI-like enzyme